MFLDIIISKVVIFIEKAHHNSLVTVSHKYVLLGGKGRLQFNLTLVIKPGQISTLILRLVEFIKFLSAKFQLKREHAGNSILIWPVNI